MNNKQSQCTQILSHLKNIGPITKLEALDLYGIMNTGARIEELRKMYHITTNMIKVPNRRGSDVLVAKYSINASKDYDKITEYKEIQAGYPETHPDYSKIGVQIKRLEA